VALPLAVHRRSRFLVASPPVQDLLFSAKHLFGAASRTRSAMGLPGDSRALGGPLVVPKATGAGFGVLVTPWGWRADVGVWG
jgi:hypothetical protein